MNTTIFADTEYRGGVRRFGMTEEERLRGVLLLGKAGMGKTQLLATLALQDMASGLPVFLIDADGTAIREVSRRIPESRISDVIRYDPREGTDVIDLGGVTSSRPIILADLSRTSLKGESATRLTEQLFGAAYAFALERDGDEGAVSFTLFLDAAGGVVHESFARFLKDARSLGIGVTLAARSLGEFSSALQESLTSGLTTLGLFQLGPYDAQHFAQLLSPHLTVSLLSSLAPGVLATNLMTDQGTLPVVIARGVTPPRLGFTPREQSFESFRSFARNEFSGKRILAVPEIPAAVLEDFLDVAFV